MVGLSAEMLSCYYSAYFSIFFHVFIQSSLNFESSATRCFPLFFFVLWSSSIEHYLLSAKSPFAHIERKLYLVKSRLSVVASLSGCMPVKKENKTRCIIQGISILSYL